jgi:hypothetical protein
VDVGDAPRETEGAQQHARSERSSSYSGRLLLRMPESLHEALVRASEAERVSLNAFINDALQKTLNPRAASNPGGAKPDSRRSSGSRSSRSPTISRLLVVNLIVVAIVGILAIVLVVQALR